MRAASPLLAMPGGVPLKLRVSAGHPDESGCGAHECARHELPSPAAAFYCQWCRKANATAPAASSTVTTSSTRRRPPSSQLRAVSIGSPRSVCTKRCCVEPGRARTALAICSRPRRSAIRMVAEFARWWTSAAYCAVPPELRPPSGRPGPRRPRRSARWKSGTAPTLRDSVRRSADTEPAGSRISSGIAASLHATTCGVRGLLFGSAGPQSRLLHVSSTTWMNPSAAFDSALSLR